MGRLSKLTIKDLTTIIENEKTTALEMAIARIMLRAAIAGCVNSLDFLLERTVGKVVDQVKVETVDTTAEQRRLIARAIFADPQSMAAAELLATRVSEQRLLANGGIEEAEEIEEGGTDDDPPPG